LARLISQITVKIITSQLLESFSCLCHYFTFSILNWEMPIESSVNLSACKEYGFSVLLSENLTWDIANNRFGYIGPRPIMDQRDIK
jgi:hypothetical protein